MSAVVPGRTLATIDGDFAVFLGGIGMNQCRQGQVDLLYPGWHPRLGRCSL